MIQKKQKIWGAIFVTAILVTAIVLLQANKPSVADSAVTTSEFTKSVRQATNEAGISVSLTNHSDAKLTREEAALILQNALHLPDKSESFQDVADECGYAGAIGAAADTGILAGVSSQKFGYGEYLTPAQQSEMITRLKTYYADRQKSYAPFKAAALQFNPVMHDRDGNVKNLCAEIETLLEQGVKLVVAPEMSTTGYGYQSREDIAPYVDTLPGHATDAISALTKKYHAYVVFGMAEKDAKTDIYYNSAALVGPEGYIGSYRKTHQWETEEHWAAWGDKGVPVFATELGNIAINVCMDAAYFESARLAAVNGADILAFPTNSSAQAVSALPARAIQNGMYIVSANRSNTELGFHMIGSSAIWSPTGKKLVEAPLIASEKEDVDAAAAYIATIDPAQYQNANKALFMQRRPELYQNLMLRVGPWDYTKSAESKHVNAVALQYTPQGSEEQNKASIQKLMENVSDADLVVLPELSLIGTVSGTPKADAKQAAEFASSLAVKYGTAVIIGAVEEKNGKLYNTSVLVDAAGKVAGTYYKTHLSESDRKWATAGDDIPVFSVDGIGKIGMLIGDDVCFPETAGVLTTKRADVIAIPSAWYGQYGGFFEINNKLSANPFPANAMVLWDAVSEGAQSYTITANFVGGEKGYLGSSALNTLDPLYGLDQPLAASKTEEQALSMSFDTLQSSWWYNQEMLINSRRCDYYKPLVAD